MTTITRASRPVRTLLCQTGFWHWSAAAHTGRLPALMAPLAFAVAGTAVAGPRTGGALASAYIGGRVVGAPIVARVLRSRPISRALPLCLVASAGLLAAAAAAATATAPVLILVALAAGAGLLSSAAGGSVRSMLNAAVPTNLVATAIAIDAVAIEVAVIASPVVVAAATSVSPLGGVLAMAAATVLAAGAFRRLAQTGDPSPSPHVPVAGTLLRNRPFMCWVSVAFGFGAAMGTVEIGAFAVSLTYGGGVRGAGALIALLSACSAAAGLVWAAAGARTQAVSIWHACGLLVVMSAALSVIAVSDTWPFTAAAVAVLGLLAAPLNTTTSYAIDAVVEPVRRIEAFSLIGSAQAMGFASAGLLLATLPTSTMLVIGAATPVVSAALAAAATRRAAGARPRADDPAPVDRRR